MNAIHVGEDEWVTLKPVHDTGQALWGLHGPTVTRLLKSYLLATDSHLVHSPSHRMEILVSRVRKSPNSFLAFSAVRA